MPGEATKQGHQDPNQSGRENDPSKKRNTPDQFDEQRLVVKYIIAQSCLCSFF